LKELTHLDSRGNVNMVDVSDKKATIRVAEAKSEIILTPETLELIENNKTAKGNVLETARITGIMGAKKTSELIPLCHPLKINKISIDFKINKDLSSISIFCKVTAEDKTGVEMEALTGASLASLAIYDMCKAYDKKMIIKNTMLISKTGGKSGDFFQSEDEQG